MDPPRRINDFSDLISGSRSGREKYGYLAG